MEAFDVEWSSDLMLMTILFVTVLFSPMNVMAPQQESIAPNLFKWNSRFYRLATQNQ